MNTDLFDLMQDWGYYLYPKTHACSPGYPAICVALRKTPTHRHFDPEAIEARLVNGHTSTERRKLGIHLNGQLPHHVCPGRLTIFDRYHKRTDFYTFGALVTAESSPEETIYSFASSAPILLLAEDEDNFPEQLEAEAEGLLAAIHVAWAQDDAAFYHRLAEIEPAMLFTAALRSIVAQYTMHPSLRERFPRFFARLYCEYQWQFDQHADFIKGPTLAELIGQPDHR